MSENHAVFNELIKNGNRWLIWKYITNNLYYSRLYGVEVCVYIALRHNHGNITTEGSFGVEVNVQVYRPTILAGKGLKILIMNNDIICK